MNKTQIWKTNISEKKQVERTGSGSRSYILKSNKIISLTNLFQQYVKNLSEWEIEFLASYFSDKSLNVYKIRKSGLLE